MAGWGCHGKDRARLSVDGGAEAGAAQCNQRAARLRTMSRRPFDCATEKPTADCWLPTADC